MKRQSTGKNGKIDKISTFEGGQRNQQENPKKKAFPKNRRLSFIALLCNFSLMENDDILEVSDSQHELITRRKYEAVTKSLRRSINFDPISSASQAKFFGELLVQSSLRSSNNLKSSNFIDKNVDITDSTSELTGELTNHKTIPNTSPVRLFTNGDQRRKFSKSGGNITPNDVLYLSSSSSSSMSSSSSLPSRRDNQKYHKQQRTKSTNLHVSSDDSMDSDSDYSGDGMVVKDRTSTPRYLPVNKVFNLDEENTQN